MKKLITRKEYMNKYENNSHILFHDYYSQFVTPEILNTISKTFGVELLKKCYATDKHFNNIPLQKWDNLSGLTRYDSRIKKQFKLTGEFWSLATNTCILKTAARILINEKDIN